MDREPIKQIIARLDRLEKAVFGPDAKAGKKIKRKNSAREGLPRYILEFRDQGFFEQPKTIKEVHGKLTTKYHCELDRVAMALLRLRRGRELRKSSKIIENTKSLAYVW